VVGLVGFSAGAVLAASVALLVVGVIWFGIMMARARR
jgi:predicted esterase